MFRGVIMKLYQAIAKRTEDLSKEKGLSQYKVAQLAGTYQQNINRLINGEIRNVSSTLVWNICCAFGLTLKAFYDDPLFDEIDD